MLLESVNDGSVVEPSQEDLQEDSPQLTGLNGTPVRQSMKLNPTRQCSHHTEFEGVEYSAMGEADVPSTGSGAPTVTTSSSNTNASSSTTATSSSTTTSSSSTTVTPGQRRTTTATSSSRAGLRGQEPWLGE